MPDQATRDVSVALPGGRVISATIPADWGEPELRARLQKDGLLPAAQEAAAPTQPDDSSAAALNPRMNAQLAQGDVGGFLATSAQKAGRQVVAAGRSIVNAAGRAVQGFGPQAIAETPDALLETAKVGISQFISESDNISKLFYEAGTGQSKLTARDVELGKHPEQLGLLSRGWRAALGALDATFGWPVAVTGKMVGKVAQDSTRQVTQDDKVAAAVGNIAETATIVFSAALGNPSNAVTAVEPEAARLMAQLTINEAKAAKTAAGPVFKAMETLGSRTAPDVAAAIDAVGLGGTTPAKAVGLRVAIKSTSGKIIIGEPGEVHYQLYDRASGELTHADEFGAGAGFADRTGTFYTREEAAKLFGGRTAKEINVQTAGGKTPLGTPLGVRPHAGTLLEPVLDQDAVKAIAEQAQAALAGKTLDPTKRITAHIVQLIGEENWSPKAIQDIKQNWGLSSVQLAQELQYAATTYGRGLNYISRTAKALRQAVKDDPAASAIFDAMEKTNPELLKPQLLDHVNRAIWSASNFWRAMLTSQAVTAIRNVGAGGATYAGEILGSAEWDIASGVAKMAKGKFQDGMKEMFVSLNAAIRTGASMSIENRGALMRVLDDPKNAYYKLQLMSRPMADLVLGGESRTQRAALLANSFNRWQEYFVRGAAMEFKLRTLLARDGKLLETTPISQISDDVLTASVEFARRTTFASKAKSQFAKDFIDGWDKLKLITYPINPFPQFTFANAIPFFVHKSSLGVFHLLSNEARAALPKLLHGEKMSVAEQEKLGQIMTDASVGTLLWKSAWDIRQKANQERPDTRWNEIPTGPDTHIDARAWWPYSFFLFASELMQRPDRIKAQDWFDNFVGLPRVGGSTLMLADLQRAKDADQFARGVKDLTGKILAGLSTPLRQFRDMIEYNLSPEDAILRDTRQDPIIGPFLNNVPYFNQRLPVKYTPLSGPIDLKQPEKEFDFLGQKYTVQAMTYRHLTGLSESQKNALMKRVDTLQIDSTVIYPNTGNREADNYIAKGQNAFLSRVGPPLLEKTKSMPDAAQRIIWGRVFSASKAYGLAYMAVGNLRLYNEVKALKSNPDMMQLMRDFGGINPYQAVDEELARRGYKAPDEQRGIKR